MVGLVGCVFVARLLEQLTVVGAESVALSAAVGDGLDRFGVEVLADSGSCLPVGLVVMLLLGALSSSSEEMSTTI